MKCPKCGSPIKENVRFCGKCGQQIARVQQTQNQQNDVNTLRRKSERPQNRSGKYSAAQPTRRAKKKESGGIWIIGLLIALIVALLCVVIFVIRPMLKNIFSDKEAVETPQYSVQEQNTTGEKKDDEGNGLFGLGGNKQIIYVVDGKSTYYRNDEDLSNVQTYEFNEEGYPIAYHYGYYNNFHSATSGYYAYDTKGITGEIISFINDTVQLNESERNKQGEKYEKELDKILKEYGINAEEVSYNILGITDDLVTTDFGGTVNSVMTYNSQGKRTERKVYWSGELFSTQTTSYIADKKPLSYETRNENSGVTSRIVYTYEAGDNPVSAEFSTIENGTMTVSGYSYYTYDCFQIGTL